MFKNYVEVLLVPISMVMWIWAWGAPVLGIILVQCVRIKYLGSHFTKTALINIDEQIKNILPEILYSMTMSPTKRFLKSLSGVKESLEQEAEADIKNGQTQEKKKQKKTSKNLSTIDEAEEDENEEPKTYEINSDEDGEMDNSKKQPGLKKTELDI